MRFVRVACCQNLFKQAWMKVLKTMAVVVVTKAVAAATVAAAAGDVAHISMMINR